MTLHIATFLWGLCAGVAAALFITWVAGRASRKPDDFTGDQI